MTRALHQASSFSLLFFGPLLYYALLRRIQSIDSYGYGTIQDFAFLIRPTVISISTYLLVSSTGHSINTGYTYRTMPCMIDTLWLVCIYHTCILNPTNLPSIIPCCLLLSVDLGSYIFRAERKRDGLHIFCISICM